jgi:hypothetical protein
MDVMVLGGMALWDLAELAHTIGDPELVAAARKRRPKSRAG